MKNEKPNVSMGSLTAELCAQMADDYASWSCRACRDSAEFTKYVEEYRNLLTVKVGTKYIKIMHDNAVNGFVVNVEDDPKFKYGDMLKAASWKTPARNFARGNVFKRDWSRVRWTGIM